MNLKNGFWKEWSTSSEPAVIYKGQYKNDIKVGIWKEYLLNGEYKGMINYNYE